MSKIWHRTWFKIVAVIVIVLVLYGIFAIYNFTTTSLQRAISPSTGYPQQFAAFGDRAGVNYEASKVAVSPPVPGGGAGTTSSEDAKVIQTADLIIEVDAVESSIAQIKDIAAKHQGFLINSNFRESTTGLKTGSARIKVPFNKFDAAITDIKAAAKFVAQETINSQDVTEEYTDLLSQIKNLRAEETQYLGIMERAVKIEDVLNVASKLADVRGRIEHVQGRINYYDARTDFSTISIQLSEEPIIEAPTEKWRPLVKAKAEITRLIVRWQGFVDNAVAFVFWLVGVAPYLIILSIIIWIITRVVRRRNHKKAVTSPGASDQKPPPMQ